MIELTAAERDRMEATHQPGQSIILRAGAERQLVCFGCGMEWPCPGRRLLDEKPTVARYGLHLAMVNVAAVGVAIFASELMGATVYVAIIAGSLTAVFSSTIVNYKAQR